jgi:competence protein ComEC
VPFPRWSEQPVFYATLALAFGIVVAQFINVPPVQSSIVLSALLIAACVLLKRSRLAMVFALAAFVPAGSICAARAERNASKPPDISAFAAESMEITAHVTATALPRFDEQDRELRSIDVDVESVSDGSNVTPIVFGARLTIHDNGKAIPNLRYGDRVRFVARLREPRNYGNPGAMDYRGYLRDKGIAALASVPSTSIEVMPGKIGTRFGFLRDRLRQSLLNHMLSLASEPCGSWLCMSRSDVGVLAAMVIGEQSLLERSAKVDFHRTGAFHILVVSGMNVGIVAFVIFWICRRVRASEWVATSATITLSLLYAYMTDMGAPILRAALTLALYLVMRMLYRERYSLNAVGTAALILLVAKPDSLFDASFQLTFLSVATLSGIVQPLLARTVQPYVQALRAINLVGYDTALAPWQAQMRLDLRLIAKKLAVLLGLGNEVIASGLSLVCCGVCRVVGLVIVTTTLQIALALPMVWYFHRLALVGMPVNVLVVPLTAVLMPVAIAATLASYLFAPTAKLLTVVSALVLHLIVRTVGWLAQVPRADWRAATPAVLTAVCCAIVFAVSLFAFKRSKQIARTAALALIAAAALVAFPRTPETKPGAAELTAIDVAQGDSLLVVSPEGRTLLIDGGGPAGFVRSNSFDVGEDVVSPYLWSRGFSRLDAVVLTHPHSDHMDGLRAVIANFRPKELWLGMSRRDSETTLLDAAKRNGTAVRLLNTGDQLALGSVLIDVLSSAIASEKVNDDSVVLRISYKDSTALLLGDAERELERRIAANAGKVDVLKVAHHGSATSTTPELLTNLHPKFAVISVGAQNSYGHPRSEVLARLRDSGALTYRTDVNGATTFYLDGKVVKAESYVPAMPMLPAAPGPQRQGLLGTPR